MAMNLAVHLVVCIFMITDSYQLVCNSQTQQSDLEASRAFRKCSIIPVEIQMLTVTKTNHGKQRASRASISRDVLPPSR